MRQGRVVLIVVIVVMAAGLAVTFGPERAPVRRAIGSLWLGPKLEGLVGRVGLDPFDPVSPVSSVALQVGSVNSPLYGRDEAILRFSYADGSSREYRAVLQAAYRLGIGGWRFTWALDYLFAPYEELPGLPLAADSAPVRLGTPRKLVTEEQLRRAPAHLGDSGLLPAAWSPQGDAVLVTLRYVDGNGASRANLWLVPAAGGDATRLRGAVGDAKWMPDGESVVYRANESVSALVRIDREGSVSAMVPLPPQASDYAVGQAGLYFAHDSSLWFIPGDAPLGSPPGRLPETQEASGSLALSRDGGLLAYSCGTDLCLSDLRQGATKRVALGPLDPAIAAHPTPTPSVPSPTVNPSKQPYASSIQLITSLAWTADGTRLAVARSDSYRYAPRVAIVGRDGSVQAEFPAGPNGTVGLPQWTPDERFLFLPAHPERGRRIVILEVASGRLFDLTPPNWDTDFSLSPDGRTLLLSNNRGTFWLAEVQYR